MTTVAKQMNDYNAVQTWLWSYADFWGLPSHNVTQQSTTMLDSLSRFCELVEKDPDAIIDD